MRYGDPDGILAARAAIARQELAQAALAQQEALRSVTTAEVGPDRQAAPPERLLEDPQQGNDADTKSGCSSRGSSVTVLLDDH